MAKILALDIGTKRTGVAETDALQIIASPLPTIQTANLLPFLANYCTTENLECLVIGEPVRHSGEPSQVEDFIQQIIAKIKAQFPALNIERQDERFTSKMASAAIAESGLPRKKRQSKMLVDQVSAVLILQSWLAKPKF